MLRKGLLLSGLTISVAVLAFQNCGSPSVTTAVNGDAKSVVADAQKLVNLVNQDLSCAVDSDCEGLTYGAKACGGPSQSVVVSKLNPNYHDILTLANLITLQEDAHNRATGGISTCSVLVAPIPHCITNLCQ